MKLVVLDRDGTINVDSDEYIKSPDEWRPIPGSIEAMARLSRAGWTVTVATNQSGLARGFFDRATLDAMHAKLRALVEAAGGRVDYIAICPHHPDDECDCRKPKPGLLDEILAKFGATPRETLVIGDSAKDVEMARARGARAMLVRTGNGRRAEAALSTAVEAHDDLAAAADALLLEKH
jgi:D-glycero-D-manno-heptose 1,7-bisphosphate phosphatase